MENNTTQRDEWFKRFENEEFAGYLIRSMICEHWVGEDDGLPGCDRRRLWGWEIVDKATGRRTGDYEYCSLSLREAKEALAAEWAELEKEMLANA